MEINTLLNWYHNLAQVLEKGLDLAASLVELGYQPQPFSCHSCSMRFWLLHCIYLVVALHLHCFSGIFCWALHLVSLNYLSSSALCAGGSWLGLIVVWWMSVASSSAGGGSGGPGEGDHPRRHPEKVFLTPEEEEEDEVIEGEGKKRGRRGGKKAKKQALLQQAYNLGVHVPKGPPRRIPKVGELQAGFPIVSVVDSAILSVESRSLGQRLQELGLNSGGVRPIQAESDPIVPKVPKAPGYPPPASSARPKSPEVGPKVASSEVASPKVVQSQAVIPRPVPSRAVPKPVPSSAPVVAKESGPVEPKPKPKTLPPPVSPKISVPVPKASSPVLAPLPPPPGPPPGEPGPGPAVAPVLRGVIREGRVSIDYHNCLDIAEAGDQSVVGIHPRNVQALSDFIRELSGLSYRVGICSYIGERGQNSQTRRAELVSAVTAFNVGRPQNQKLGLRIVSKSYQKAACLRDCGFSVHIDDREDILYHPEHRGLITINWLFNWDFSFFLKNSLFYWFWVLIFLCLELILQLIL